MFNSKKLLLGLGLALAFSLPAKSQIFGGTSPSLLPDGTVSGPSYSFASDPNDGLYRAGSHQIGMAINGINVGTWSSTGYSSPFASTATSYFATAGSSPGGTVAGTQIWSLSGGGAISFIDPSRTINNRKASFHWFGGDLHGYLVNDAGSATTEWLKVTGGQAAGITGITSNSGSGTWAHTGAFSTSGNNTLGGSVANSHTINGDITLIDDTAVGLTLSRSGGGAKVRLGAEVAGFGGYFDARNNANTDYEKLLVAGEYISLFARTGVNTAAEVARITSTGLAVTGTLTASSAGPHSIGNAAVDTNRQLILQGTFTGASNTVGLGINSTLVVPANGVGYASAVQATINKAGSGTHSEFVGMFVEPPAIGAGAAALTNAATIKINATPSGATNNYGLWNVGNSRFDSVVGGNGTSLSIGGNSATEQVRVSHVASAVNIIQIAGAATAGAPYIAAIGSDTNVGLNFTSQGNLPVTIYTNTFGSAGFQVLHTANSTRFITATGSNGGDPILSTSAGSISVGTSISMANAKNITLAGGGQVIGTATGVGYTFNGDTSLDTGLGWIAENAFAAFTGGTERIRFPARMVISFNSFLQANIATHLTTNGDIGYCSDCTIANPCAGGGTGAFAKRLNGVNVCN